MIDHMGINSADFETSKAFYNSVFAALGGSLLMTIPKEHTGGKGVIGYGRGQPQFWVTEGKAEGHNHFAFSARSRAEVDAFYKAAIKAGGKDNGGPGLRPHYHEHYYGAFVFDPDGNNVEAVCHAPEA
jgi:catechol 2,3-dioxygenase-like lactoylglutathione lyase family enzyme